MHLTKNDAHYQWTSTHQKTFEYLNDSLSVIPLLAYSDPNQTYTLYTDVCGTCNGTCLTQACETKESDSPNVSN